MANLLERAVRRAARSAVSRPALAGLGAAIVPLLLAVTPAAGHGETFFQLGAERVQPGAQVELRADLGAGEAFDVTLIGRGDGTRRFLATLPATEEGHLQTYLTIPADVAAGDYLVEIAYDVTVLRAPLTVAGAPIAGEDGQLPGQDEGIGVVPASAGGRPASSGVPADGPTVSGVARSPFDGAFVVVVALVAGLALIVAMRLAGRRASR